MKLPIYKKKVKIFSCTNSFDLECEINKFLETINQPCKFYFSTCEVSFDVLIEYIEEV